MPRECKVLALRADGVSSAALELIGSEETVKSHVNHVLAEVVSAIARAAHYAYDHGVTARRS